MEIELDRATYLPGDAVNVRVRLANAQNGRARGARVELLYTSRYRERQSSDERAGTEERTDDVAVTREPFGAIDPAHRGIAAGEHSVTLRLPETAPPTAAKFVEWKARAVIDRRLAPDLTAEIPFTVLAPPVEPKDDPSAPPPVWAMRDAIALARHYRKQAQPDAVRAEDCELSFRLEGRTVRAGATIAGRLVLRANADLTLSDVRVELVLYRVEGRIPAWQVTNAAPILRLRVGEPGSIASGEARTYPFSLRVPDNAPPSLRAEGVTLDWYLVGIASLPRRPDFDVRTRINVYNADVPPRTYPAEAR